MTEHMALDGHEAGHMYQEGDVQKYGWVMVADGGAWAASNMKFCPWCGTKLPGVAEAIAS
jgi:hypothetical protein